MTKKIINYVLKILLICLIYIFQLYVLNNVSFFGVKVNLPLMLIAVISLIYKKSEIYILSVVNGVLSDVLFSSVMGKYLIIYVIVATLLIGLKNTYKQDNKLSVVLFSFIATVICEVILLIFNLFEKSQMINIVIFVWRVFKESIFNIFFAYFIYLILRKISVKEWEFYEKIKKLF